MTLLDKVHVLIFAHHNSSLYVFGVLNSRGGGTPDKGIPEGKFCEVFRQTSRLNIRPSKRSSFYVFGVLVDITERGERMVQYLIYYM